MTEEGQSCRSEGVVTERGKRAVLDPLESVGFFENILTMPK
jgi:hypothetical protein